MDVQAHDGAEVLAPIFPSYFDRTWEHFCSHRQTPSAGVVGNPGIVRSGSVVYFSSPLFTLYDRVAPFWCKRLFLNALEMCLPQPLVRHGGPSTLFVTLNEQAAEGRQVLHLLHYIPERRGTQFDIIEDVIPLYDVPLSLRVSRAVASVMAVGSAALPFITEGDRINFTVPTVHGPPDDRNQFRVGASGMTYQPTRESVATHPMPRGLTMPSWGFLCIGDCTRCRRGRRRRGS